MKMVVDGQGLHDYELLTAADVHISSDYFEMTMENDRGICQEYSFESLENNPDIFIMNAE